MNKNVTVFLLVGLWVFAGSLQAATNVSSKDQAVQEVGVAWNMASDRKIENDGGLYQPEGLDKYMKRYFDQFTAKIDQLIERTDRLEKKIDALSPAKPKGGTLVSSQDKRNY
ncbi:MAG: hypothetical protein WCJ71_05355 [Candidatus Omnitrophota bacterium]